MQTPRPSTAALPAPDGARGPWPGEQVSSRGGPVFVRHTPWVGPVGGAAGDPGGAVDAPRERALYVHGLGGAATNWTDFAAAMAVRVDGWALDLPGFGASPPPRRRGFSLQRHVEAVVDVLEWVVDQPDPVGAHPPDEGDAGRGTPSGRGRPVHLVGNSLGGLVSLAVAVRRPDLVATLTLVSPAMPVYRVPPAFRRAILLVLLPGVPALAGRRLARVSAEQRVRGMLAMCFGDPSRVPADRVRQAVEEMREHDEQPWAGLALTQSLRGLMTSYLRPGRSAWRAARRVTQPTLVVWGDRDRLVDPALAPRLAAALPDARLYVQEGIGHVAMMEAPEPTARAVLGLLEEVAGRPDAAPGPVAGARRGRRLGRV
ncbi:alpha/beta fold hydrolase [Modestobacter sp. I12A-02628]|uniref:Alpha/beta hydrolase n=1 Tax=Goekera deserti TaxID=2497753 RepID=A0A7K3W7U1_9ACTN|nr:alpha/beta hydrolase [Goekera deserti]MPQ99836.1 alpha/beta fold hydrolase [Goekera deserti]NDI49992.1 alpha/beta fold hydrolase [Goekera deserti]NEL52531.1 alpha/beta hydrolase [Goekera deserti]